MCGVDQSFLAAPHTPRKWLLSMYDAHCAQIAEVALDRDSGQIHVPNV
jgi:hypothetical protein